MMLYVSRRRRGHRATAVAQPSIGTSFDSPTPVRRYSFLNFGMTRGR